MKIIKIIPVFKEKIWGGTSLNDIYGYEIPSDHTGECWAISAHKDGDCYIENEEYKGKTLSQLYSSNRELFGNVQYEEFPLLAKLLDAKDNLSIQVHPSDDYARKVENQEYGKNEAWYILNCNDDTNIEIGHNAKDKEELADMIKTGKWDDLLSYKKINKGDCFFIKTGTVHAICKGSLIYEIQQSSDITYRLYDYDRVDNTTGTTRELHIDKCIDVIEVPQKNDPITPVVTKGENFVKTLFVENDYFNYFKYDISGKVEINEEAPFIMCTVTDGQGSIGEEVIKKGDNFIVPANYGAMQFDGNLEILMATI